MNLQRIEQCVEQLEAEASFLFKITSSEEHTQALELMEVFIEDYDKHEPLIDLLCNSIEHWESTAEEFQEFNKKISAMDSGVAVLATLMDQYKLNTTHFKNEIGGKSLVSMILKGTRPLNLNHIRKLATRFNVPAQLFI